MYHVVQRLGHLLSAAQLQQRAEREGIQVVWPTRWEDHWLVLTGSLPHYPGLLDHGPISVLTTPLGEPSPHAYCDEALRRLQVRHYDWGVDRREGRFVHRHSGRAVSLVRQTRLTRTLQSSAMAQARHAQRQALWDAFRATHPVMLATLTAGVPRDAASLPIALPFHYHGRIAFADAPDTLLRYGKGRHLGVRPVAGTRDLYRIVPGKLFLTTIAHMLGPGLRGVHVAGQTALVFVAPTHDPLWDGAAEHFRYFATGYRVRVIPDWEYPEVTLRALWRRDHVDVSLLSGNRYALRIPDPRPRDWWQANLPFIYGLQEHYRIRILPPWSMVVL